MVKVHALHVQMQQTPLRRRRLPSLDAELQEGGQGFRGDMAKAVRKEVGLEGLEEGAGLYVRWYVCVHGCIWVGGGVAGIWV